MKQELQEHDGHDELVRLVYHNDKRAISAFRKRLSDDADQDPLDALAAEQRYMLQVDWNAPDYATIVSDLRKLKQCSGLAVNWNELRKLALWLDGQEREAGEYWSISFVKILASALGHHGLEALVMFDGVDPGWAAMALPCHENARRTGDLLGSLLDAEWIVGSVARWDSPKAITKEIQRRLAAIVNEP